jgi:hypothetical protein
MRVPTSADEHVAREADRLMSRRAESDAAAAAAYLKAARDAGDQQDRFAELVDLAEEGGAARAAPSASTD